MVAGSLAVLSVVLRFVLVATALTLTSMVFVMWIFLDWIEFVFWGELWYGMNAILCDEVMIRLNENILSFLTSLSYFATYDNVSAASMLTGCELCHLGLHKPHKVMSALIEGFASS